MRHICGLRHGFDVKLNEVIIITILIAILVFGALIFVHELGHYTFARIFKVGIKEFAIGMGPKLVSKTSQKTGIAYSLRLLPIGGFVSMDGEDEESTSENSFGSKPAWQRAIVLVAGGAVNILVGIILMATLAISAKTLVSNTVGEFVDGASSCESGLQVGDTIVKVGNSGTHISYDLAYAIMREGTEPVDVTVIRDGEKLLLRDVVFPTSDEGGIVTGAADFRLYAEEKTFTSVVKHAYYESVTSVRLIWDSLIDLVKGKYGIDQMSGPVGVTTAIGDAAKSGFDDLLYFTALLALNLGIMNLLPLPALDGGRVVFVLIELIRGGKKIKPEIEGYIHTAGIALLMLLMLVVTFKDITRLFG